ncbi:hypothetical protein G8C41_06160 [Apibacter sp. B3706]|uniref:hypothetical protein n=1 Tax=Apibacter sp. B3706 TaxID=2656760 RepID=UPI00140B7B7B|nr:hypothetical protein [Apibacter sp. B3706]QII70416.1 hypothetical protein G8C41_06160 [Apibacter sp. B3706]
MNKINSGYEYKTNNINIEYTTYKDYKIEKNKNKPKSSNTNDMKKSRSEEKKRIKKN